MWLFLTDSFFSIVKKDCKADELLVRARRPGDIEKVFPDAKIVVLDTSDYRYRATIKTAEVEKTLARRLSARLVGDDAATAAEAGPGEAATVLRRCACAAQANEAWQKKEIPMMTVFHIRHQRIGKVVCCNLLAGETGGMFRLCGSFIMSLPEFDAFTERATLCLTPNSSSSALCVAPIDFEPAIQPKGFALLLDDRCYLDTLAFACQALDPARVDSGALLDIISALEPHRSEQIDAARQAALIDAGPDIAKSDLPSFVPPEAPVPANDPRNVRSDALWGALVTGDASHEDQQRAAEWLEWAMSNLHPSVAQARLDGRR